MTRRVKDFKMKNRVVFFIVALIIWILLAWSLNWQHLVVGFLVCVLVAFIVGDLFTENFYKFKEPKRYLWLLYYIPVFLWEMIKANIDVAYRVMHPKLPIKPGIVKVKTKLKSESGLTFLANSITLTPGTMSVDIDKENGYIYVHWINVKAGDIENATRIIVDRFERILSRIFE
jgi:multicomponent Na+:H+ antiporter subunit E